MNYLDIKHCNMVNGVGLRSVIWVSGCTRHCPGCFNPASHDFNAGITFDDNAKEELFKDSNTDWCDGITILGGEPLEDRNFDTVLAIAKEYKERFPNKTIWLYTSYCWNELVSDEKRSQIIKYCSVICDGPFVESLKDVNLQWVGSSNQHVIDVKKRIADIQKLV